MRTTITLVVVLVVAAPAFADTPLPVSAEPAPVVGVEPEPAVAPAASPIEIRSSVLQAIPVAGETIALGGQTDYRSYASDWMVAPEGGTIGGALRMFSVPRGPNGAPIAIGDLALLTLHGQWTATKRLALAGSVDLLAKQPDDRRDVVLQGAAVSGKLGLTAQTALSLATSAGPTLGDDGYWGSAAIGAIHRSPIESFLALQLTGTANAIGLRQDMVGRRWLSELGFSSQLVLHMPGGQAAVWGGIDIGVPIAHSAGLDPTSRLGATLGALYSAVENWDLYVEVSWRDRGTMAMPATTLPIVDGGFDQRTVTFGITRRFTKRGAAMWNVIE